MRELRHGVIGDGLQTLGNLDSGVVEVDRRLGVDGGGSVTDLVDVVGGNNLVRAISRTGDVRHHDASRVLVMDDLEGLLGLGVEQETLGACVHALVVE